MVGYYLIVATKRCILVILGHNVKLQKQVVNLELMVVEKL